MCESREFLPAPSFAQFEVVLIRRQHYLIRTRAQKKKEEGKKKHKQDTINSIQRHSHENVWQLLSIN